MSIIGIPLADCADEWIGQLALVAGSKALAELDGATLLGERAMLNGMAIPNRISAGGGCRLYDAVGDRIALNLARAADRELLPALFAIGDLNPNDNAAIGACIADSDAVELLMRGRSMGLAIAAEHELSNSTTHACTELVKGTHANAVRNAPRVVDLSALWAGPLAAHLLWLAGANVVKVESRSRPDAMRGDNLFYALLNQGKASVVLDFANPNDREALLALIADADIVIEAARPRALAQLGIDAEHIINTTPGLTWITITGHGAVGEASNWVGFGDDCGVAGGLSAALRAATGHSGFVGDASADPLTGIFAARVAWQAWQSRQGGRFGLAMSRVAAQALTEIRAHNSMRLDACLKAWHAAVGQPFPSVAHRLIGNLPAFGQDTHACLSRVTSC